MLRTLSALPPTVPTLDPVGAGLTHGPRYALERVLDAGGTSAASVCWQLWCDHGLDGSPLRVPYASLNVSDPLASHAMGVTRVSQGAAHEARGAGYILFADLSLLIFQRSDRQAWSAADLNPGQVDILPVVFRITPVIPTRGGNVRIETRQADEGLSLSFKRSARKDTFDPPKVIHEQIAREVGAWAAWIRYMPALAKPVPEGCNPHGDWPAFFPREVLRHQALKDFQDHVLKTVQSVMAWVPKGFHQAQVSAWSSRPLQGGVEPIKIALNWQMAPTCPPYQTDALQEHVNSLVFAENLPWRMDDFPALKLFKGAPGAAHTSADELFTCLVQSPTSNHERLSLRASFPPPPPPPPLPGQAGYGNLKQASSGK